MTFRVSILFVSALFLFVNWSCGPSQCKSDSECQKDHYCELSLQICKEQYDECRPGLVKSCKNKLDGQPLKGLCKAGKQYCLPQQKWGPCEGAIEPTDEQCDQKDNDCDGKVDNQCKYAKKCNEISFKQRFYFRTEVKSQPFAQISFFVSLKVGKPDLKWLPTKWKLFITGKGWTTKGKPSFTKQDGLKGWSFVLQKKQPWEESVKVRIEGDLEVLGAGGVYCPFGAYSKEFSLQCKSKEKKCEGVCTELSSSAQHCGACGQSCKAPKRCCNGQCVDLSSSSQHCSKCENQCQRGMTCRKGKCFACERDSDCSNSQSCRKNQCIRCPNHALCDRSFRVSRSNSSMGYGILVNKKGDLTVAGTFSKTLELGNQSLKGNTNQNLFIARWDVSWKRLLWVKTATGEGHFDRVKIQADAQDRITFGSEYGWGIATVFDDKGSNSKILAKRKVSEEGAFVAGIENGTTGKLGWSVSLGMRRLQHFRDLHTSPSGNSWVSFITRYYESGALCEGQKTPLTKEEENLLGTKGSQVMALVKMDTKGKCLWGRVLPITPNASLSSPPYHHSVVSDSKGNAFWFFFATQTAKFGKVKNPHSPDLKGKDIPYLAKLSPSGEFLWVRELSKFSTYENLHRDHFYELALASDGSLYLGGTFKGRLQIEKTILVSYGKSDVFLAKFSPEGGLRWAKRFGGGLSDSLADLVVAKDGNIYMTGSFEGVLPDVTPVLKSVGQSDVFVIRWSSDGRITRALRAGGLWFDKSKSLYWSEKYGLFVVGSFSSPTIRIGEKVLKNIGLEKEPQRNPPRKHFPRNAFVWNIHF